MLFFFTCESVTLACEHDNAGGVVSRVQLGLNAERHQIIGRIGIAFFVHIVRPLRESLQADGQETVIGTYQNAVSAEHHALLIRKLPCHHIVFIGAQKTCKRAFGCGIADFLHAADLTAHFFQVFF